MRRKICLFLLAILFCVPVLAHAVLNNYNFSVIDEDGNILSTGFRVQIQAAGGSTAETIYSDQNGLVSTTNPITSLTGTVSFFYGGNTCDVVVYDQPLTTKIKKAGVTPLDHKIVFPKTQITSEQMAITTLNISGTGTLGVLSVTGGSTVHNASFSDSSITNVGDIALDSITADNATSFSMGSNWTNAGRTIADLGIVTTVDVNGGSVDGVTIGGASAGVGTFTDLNLSDTLLASKTEAAEVADGKRYYDFEVNTTKDPAANATVSSLYGAYNWSAGTNGTFIAQAVEGATRSKANDESGTFRGGYFRTYIDTDTDTMASMRTNVALEVSPRAAYVGGTAALAESGTAFVGERIWMAPYFSAGTVDNVNNFWGLWIYGEHATQRNADSAIKMETAGGGFTKDIIFQNGESITNSPNGTLTFDGALSGTSTVATDQDVGVFTYGTWTNDDAHNRNITGQTEHFVPFQTNLSADTNITKDIASARFRVNTGINTAGAIGNLQLRQSIAHNVGSSANINASTSIDTAVVVGTGSILGGYFSIEGSGAVTKAGDNDITPLVAVNNNIGGGVDNVFVALQNGTGTTVQEVIKAGVTNGTATVGINIENSAGTLTTGLKMTGTIGTDISLQNGETITNSADGTVAISGILDVAGLVLDVVDKDTNYAILSTDTGKVITNYGAPLSLTFTLPTAAAGLVVDILHTDTDNLKVVKSGSDTILGTTNNSLVIATGTLGGSLKLIATRALQWVITGREDTWTDTTVLP